jgi:hypothetical protein
LNQALMGMMELDRRKMLQTAAATIASAVAGAAPAAAQVKWSGGTERPRLQAPLHACDCHHFIYDSRYPVDRRGIPFPGDALVEDYRALQRRLGITRQVIVQPSTYGLDNRATLAALAALGGTHEVSWSSTIALPTPSCGECISGAFAAFSSISPHPGRPRRR